MTSPGGREERRAQARHADEETRYQAVSLLDPSDPEERAVLVERLGDPSWRVRSAAVDRLGAAPGGAAALPALLEALSSGPTVGAREAAAAALGRLGAAAVSPLLERLAAGDSDLRQAVAGVLAAIADGRAVAPLTARLADPDPNVRAAAAEALGRIGGRQAEDALRAALDSDDGTLRLSAAEALLCQGASLPRAAIERLLADRTLRRPAYRLLGTSHDPEALPLLARGVAEPARMAREAALAALALQRARRGPEALAPLLDDVRGAARVDPGLADAWAASIASEDADVAAGAVGALAAGGGPRHVSALLRAADDDRLRPLVEEALDALPSGPALRDALANALPGLGQAARITALSALARLGSPAAFESLVREASDPGSYLQAEAVAALGRLADARAVEPLAGLLGDDLPEVAALAATALVRIGSSGPSRHLPVLEALRARAEASPSAALYRTLGAVGDRSDLEVLVAALRVGSVEQRGAAAAAVATLGRRGLAGDAALPALVAAIADPAWSVRAAAARAFAELARAPAGGGNDPASLERAARGTLRRALFDAEAAVRAAVIDALGACGPASADAIAAVADDPAAPAPVVVAAFQALAALGVPHGGAVARAAAHPDPEVVKEAVRAAARLPGPEGERIVRAAAADPRWDVRQAAARAMADRGDPALGAEAARLAAAERDPLVARAFAEAARGLGRR